MIARRPSHGPVDEGWIGSDALSHPITVAAICVWLLNDHVLKGRFPGFVTGKLSDVAGLIVTPILVVALVGWFAPRTWRPHAQSLSWGSAGVVTAAFVAAKTWTPANALYGLAYAALRAPVRLLWEAISGIPFQERITLVMDPTDLLALPAALVAVWLCGRPGHS